MSGADASCVVHAHGMVRGFEMRRGEVVIGPLMWPGVIRSDRIVAKKDFGFHLSQIKQSMKVP